MDDDELIAEVRQIRQRLSAGDLADVLHRVQGLHRMARVVASNAQQLRVHLSVLDTPGTALPLLALDAGHQWDDYLDEAERCVHNYLLSALPLTEHARAHVDQCYADGHAVKEQFLRAFDLRLSGWPVHEVARALRNYSAHRALPRLTCVSIWTSSEMTHRLAMDRRELLRDPRWPGYGRIYLDALPDENLFLDYVLLAHASRIDELFSWFFQVQAVHDIDGLREVERAARRHDEILGEG